MIHDNYFTFNTKLDFWNPNWCNTFINVKEEKKELAKNYRPITCLKITNTKVISMRLQDHLVPAEQKGCFKNIAWIEYKKAFDQVPHTWIFEALEMYKISTSLLYFSNIKKTWKKGLHLMIETFHCYWKRPNKKWYFVAFLCYPLPPQLQTEAHEQNIPM